MNDLLETLINPLKESLTSGNFDAASYFNDANGLMGRPVIGQEILEYVLQDIITNYSELSKQFAQNNSVYQSKPPKDNNYNPKKHRTYSIMRDGNGALHLFIEVKQKLLDGSPPAPRPDLPAGADYTMKIAYEVGLDRVTPYASLVAHYDPNTQDGQEKLSRLEDAARISNKFVNTAGFCASIFGAPRDGKFTVYAPYRPDGTLGTIIKNKTLSEQKLAVAPEPTQDPQNIHLQEQLLNILKQLYTQKISHKDIKPDNFLIHKDEKGNTILSLTDFGYSVGYGDTDTLKLSPQFVNPYKLLVLSTIEKMEAFFIGTKIYRPPDFSIETSTSNNKADSSHDTYAIGKIIFRLTYGAYPEDFTASAMEHILAHDPLLDKMLGKESASGNLSPESLIDLFKATRYKEQPKPKVLPSRKSMAPGNGVFSSSRTKSSHTLASIAREKPATGPDVPPKADGPKRNTKYKTGS